MKKSVLITLVVSLVLMFTMLSCEQPNNTIPVQEFSTPTIKGTVSLPSGSTVNPADIFVKVIDSTGATAKVQKANSDSTFVIQGLNADMSYSILFSSVEPEFANRDLSRDPDKSNGVGGWIHDVKPIIKDGNDIGSVKLKPLGTIRGKALMDGMSEHYDTTIYIPGTSYIAMTNADGTFAIYNVPEGTYRLRYNHDGYMPVMSDEVILTCPEGADDPTVTVKDVNLISNNGTVVGKAVYDGESDNTGITVLLENEDKTIRTTGSTSADGTFIYNDVVPGKYRILVSASGYLPVYSSYFTVDPATTVTVPDQITLFRNIGTIQGKATLAGISEDNSGIAISIVGESTGYTAVTSTDGSFIKTVKPGSYTVTASYPGYSSQTIDVTVTENNNSSVVIPELPLSSGGVAGTVILTGSDDFSGVVVTLTDSEAATTTYTELTGADGSYRFTGLKKGGTYFMTFSKDGYVTDRSRSINVTVGSVSVAESVTLRSTTATLKGKIQLEGASSYENVTILLKNDKNQYTSTTDQKGEYIINRILPGTYSLLASKDGFVTGQISEFVIEPSADKQADLLTLSIAIKSVTGSVELELATDHAGVLVTATNLSDNKLIYSAITNSSGNFTLAGMKSGEYSVVLSCNGYNTITLPTINVNDTTVYTLEKQNMAISRGKIAGLVKLEGYTDHSGVLVTLLGTEYTTTTLSDGSFEFNVPTANYPGGLRFEKDDMETAAYAETIPVLVNSTYAIKSNILMSAVNVPVVRGVVKVGGTEDWSSVTVKLVEKPEFALVTGPDGAWSFEHVPLGKYTIEYTRENAKKVTSILDAKASPLIEIPALTIIPDSASIEGHVALDSVTDYSGVTVRVTTSGVANELSTTTDSTGYFYLGNLLSTGKHTVSIEKEGWNTQVIELNNLEPLSLTDITSGSQIILKDTTSPALSSVSINSGANATGARTVNITVNGFDAGSGIALMQYSWTDSFSASSWINYASSFDITIPDENNGTKTLRLRVKDYAGNESVIVSDSIELINQIKSIGGQLSVNELHWVKENNPYVITDDVIIPEGRTLEIDPGVDILFTGNYSILVRGTLSAKGTESEHIVFRSSKDYMEKEYNCENFINYDGVWGGISAGTNSLEVNRESYNYDLISGSEMSYCDVKDIGNGIRGNIYISNSTIFSNIYALGNQESKFTGVLLNCNITGSAFLGENSIIFGNEFTATDEQFNVPSYAHYESGGNYYWWYNPQDRWETYYVDDQIYNGYDEEGKGYNIYYNWLENYDCRQFVNNVLNGYVVKINNWSDYQISFSTFEDCKFRFNGSIYSILEYCEFINNQNTIEISSFRGIRFSNFIDNTNQYLLKTNSNYTNRSTHDMRFNYWDKENTNKLNSISNSSNPNVDFFYDGIDNIDLSVIDYNNYVSEPWDMAGYQGDHFCDFNARFVRQYEWSDEAKVGSDVEIDLEMLTDDTISKYRVAQSVDALLNSDWITYYGSSSYSGSDVDYDMLNDGYLELYLQVRTSDGAFSPIKTIRVGYDIPSISNLSITDGYTITKDNKISMTVNSKNAGDGFRIYAWIDGVKIENSWWFGSGKNEINNIIDPTKLLNGAHILRLQTEDNVGDTYEVSVNFFVERPTPIVTDLSVENPNVGPGNDLKISVLATNTKHLKQMRIVMDEVVINQKDYADNTPSSITESISVESIYLKDGAHSIQVVMEDYTGNITYSDTVSVNISSNNSSAPLISNLDFENGKTFTDNKIESFTMNVRDDGGISLIDVTLDGNTNLYYFYDNKYQAAYREIDANVILRIPVYKNGKHTVNIKVADFAGNTTEIDRDFVVERSLPSASLSINPENESYCYWIYSSPNTSWIYDGGLYLDDKLLDYRFKNNGDSSESYFGSGYVYNYQIPSGEHTLEAKYRMQSGEIIESDSYFISKTKSSSTFDYGEGKTWNGNGTLLKDSYTYFLWNFDSSEPAKENVSGKFIGSVIATTEGIGGKAATVYIDNNELKMQFPNGTWTIEFWAKNGNRSTDSDMYVNLYDVSEARLYKRGASEYSWIRSYFNYQTMMGNVGRDSISADYSRDNASSWHHYAIVSDGYSLQIFIDGLMRNKTEGDKPSVKIANGIYVWMPEGVFIDELRISNRARSIDELWDYNQFVRERNLIPQ